MEAVERNETWFLIPQTPQHNKLSCKWVYRLKQDDEGKVTRNKARLVDNGMRQIDSVDVQDTFAPVVKPFTIRIVLFIVVSKGWVMRQLDVSNAFLHGILQLEDVFMLQPLGFHDKELLTYICHLRKSFYKLKQSP